MAADGTSDEKQKLAEKLSKEINARAIDLEPFIQKAIQKVIDKLSTGGGKLLKDKYNKKVALYIEKEVQDAIQKSDFFEILKDYIPVLSTIESGIVSEQLDVNNIELKVNESLRNYALDQFETSLKTLGINERIVNPIKAAIVRAVVTGGTVRQLETELRGVNAELIGNSFTQTLYDSMRFYEGAINQKIAVDFEMNAWLYTGPVIQTTRKQCKRWVEEKNGVLLFSEIQKEIDWAYENGSGMIPETTPQNFASHCGGYDCRHTATPTIR